MLSAALGVVLIASSVLLAAAASGNASDASAHRRQSTFAAGPAGCNPLLQPYTYICGSSPPAYNTLNFDAPITMKDKAYDVDCCMGYSMCLDFVCIPLHYINEVRGPYGGCSAWVAREYGANWRGNALSLALLKDSRFKDHREISALKTNFRAKVQRLNDALKAKGIRPTISATLRTPGRAFLMRYTDMVAKRTYSPIAKEFARLDRVKQIALAEIAAAYKGNRKDLLDVFNRPVQSQLQNFAKTVSFSACEKLDGRYEDPYISLKVVQDVRASFGKLAHLPSLTSNHFGGQAIDWTFAWNAKVKMPVGPEGCTAQWVPKKKQYVKACTPCPKAGFDGCSKIQNDKSCSVEKGKVWCIVPPGRSDTSQMMWAVGATYGVHKFMPAAKDRPHWSFDGR